MDGYLRPEPSFKPDVLAIVDQFDEGDRDLGWNLGSTSEIPPCKPFQGFSGGTLWTQWRWLPEDARTPIAFFDKVFGTAVFDHLFEFTEGHVRTARMVAERNCDPVPDRVTPDELRAWLGVKVRARRGDGGVSAMVHGDEYCT